VAPTDLRRPVSDPARPLDASAFQRARAGTRLCPRHLELPPQHLLCTFAQGAISQGLAAAHDQALVALRVEAGRLGLLNRLGEAHILIPAAPAGPDDPAFRILVGCPFQGLGPAAGSLTPDLQTLELAGGRFAVFRHLGPSDTVWQTWFQVFHDWAATGVRLRPGLPFQRPAPAANAIDIHIPIL
jgi:AraC family transcriptional regulator